MTPEDALRRLTEVIPPPSIPRHVAGRTVNEIYGPPLELPDDYLEFLRIYGPGSFTENGNQVARMHDLVTTGDLQIISDHLEMMHWVTQSFHTLVPAVYPSVPGLLPFGDLDAGIYFYWCTEGPPDEWPVTVYRQGEILRFEYSMVEFLAVNFAGAPGNRLYTDLGDEFPYDGFRPAPQSEY